MLPHAVFADALIQGHDLPSARHLPRQAPFRMWLRPLIVVDDPRVDAERAGRSMVTKRPALDFLSFLSRTNVPPMILAPRGLRRLETGLPRSQRPPQSSEMFFRLARSVRVCHP